MVKLVVRLVGVEPGYFQDLDYPKHGSQSNQNNVDLVYTNIKIYLSKCF
jgi:hypothetical protein